MSKFCSNCGFALEDDDRFCPQCGNATSSEAPAEPTPAPAQDTFTTPSFAFEEPVSPAPAAEPAPAPAAGTPYTPPTQRTPYPYPKTPVKPAPVKKKASILPLIITVAVIAVILVAGFFTLDHFGLFGNLTYKGAVKNYIQFHGYGKTEFLKDLAPKEFWDYLEEEDGVDFDEAQEIIDERYENFDEMIEEEYGEDYKVKYKTKSKSEVSKSKLKKIAKALKEDYDIKSSKVTKGYKLKLEVSFSGSEDEGEEDLTVYVLKISGKWYVVDIDEYGGSYYVSFINE